MYNSATLKSSLLGLVGWRQNIDPSGTQLTALTTSETGMYYNDEHPLLTIDNLLSVAYDFKRIDSDQSAINTAFSTWLQQKTESGIIKGIDAWLSKKFKKKTARNLLANKHLFNVSGSLFDYQENQNKVVGLEVVPRRANSVKMEIKRVGIWLETNQTVTVKLFDSSKAAPIQSVDIVYTGSGGLQWEAVNWEVDGTGAYYVVYDQKTITDRVANTIQDYNWHNRGFTAFPTEKFYTARAFSVTGGTTALWDIRNNSYTLSTNYGLNLDLDVRCDYTNLIVDQKTLFAEVIRKQVAIDLLFELIHNPNSRENRNINTTEKQQLLFELEGDPQGRPTGLKWELEQAITKTQFDFTDIDKICLPCQKRSVTYSSV